MIPFKGHPTVMGHRVYLPEKVTMGSSLTTLREINTRRITELDVKRKPEFLEDEVGGSLCDLDRGKINLEPNTGEK